MLCTWSSNSGKFEDLIDWTKLESFQASNEAELGVLVDYLVGISADKCVLLPKSLATEVAVSLKKSTLQGVFPDRDFLTGADDLGAPMCAKAPTPAKRKAQKPAEKSGNIKKKKH